MFIYCNVKLGWTPAKKRYSSKIFRRKSSRNRQVSTCPICIHEALGSPTEQQPQGSRWDLRICGSAWFSICSANFQAKGWWQFAPPGAATFERWDPGPPAKRHMAAEFFFFRGKFGKGWTWQVQSIYKNILKQRKTDWVFFVVFHVAMGLIHPHQQLDGLMDSVPTQPFRASGCGLWSPQPASQLRNVWGLVLPIQSSSHSLQNLLLEAMRYRNGREGVLRSSGWSRSISLFFQETLLKGDRRDENQSVGSVKFLSLSMYSNGVT